MGFENRSFDLRLITPLSNKPSNSVMSYWSPTSSKMLKYFLQVKYWSFKMLAMLWRVSFFYFKFSLEAISFQSESVF